MEALELIEPPELLIEVSEAKEFLRISDDDSSVISDDPLILNLIATATAFLDGMNGFLGRALGRQRYRLTLDAFPRDEIEVPLPPLQSVDLIRDVRPDQITADLPTSQFRVAIPGTAAGGIRARGLWPPTARDSAAVTIEFTAGYETLPDPIRTAILQHVGLLYENRETAAYGSASFQTVPFAGRDLIESYRRWIF